MATLDSLLIVFGLGFLAYGLFGILSKRMSVGLAIYSRNLVGKPAQVLGYLYILAGLMILSAMLLVSSNTAQWVPSILFADGLFVVIIGNLFGVMVARR